MIYPMQCCGLREVSGLRFYEDNPKGALLDFIQTNGNVTVTLRYSNVIFTEAGNGKYATQLARFIRRHKLGKVYGMREFHNPNSGNPVRMFVWEMDRQALYTWFEANKPKV